MDPRARGRLPPAYPAKSQRHPKLQDGRHSSGLSSPEDAPELARAIKTSAV